MCPQTKREAWWQLMATSSKATEFPGGGGTASFPRFCCLVPVPHCSPGAGGPMEDFQAVFSAPNSRIKQCLIEIIVMELMGHVQLSFLIALMVLHILQFSP